MLVRRIYNTIIKLSSLGLCMEQTIIKSIYVICQVGICMKALFQASFPLYKLLDLDSQKDTMKLKGLSTKFLP